MRANVAKGKIPKLSIVCAILAISSAQSSYSQDDFSYFREPEIDFWKAQGESEKLKAVPSDTTLRKAGSSFPWKKYLDPKNDEFFKEGDYTPPAPFMEIARNPSDENIAQWFHYLALKNALTRRLQERLEAFGAKSQEQISFNKTQTPDFEREHVERALDPKRYRLRLYFDSKCPHCERMLKTVAELSRLGFWVELKQIDSDLSARAKIPFPVTSATSAELKSYQIDAVPVLLVGDLKRGTFFKIQGEQPADSILQAIQSKPNST